MDSGVTRETEPGLVIPRDVAERVNSALADKRPIAVAYVTPDGRPVLSLRGSTHVHGDDQLAIWVRHARGGLIESVTANPNVSLLYRDSQERTTFVFSGRAHVSGDDATRKAVYDASPEAERDHDPERQGAALIIDVDAIQGGTVGGSRISLERR